MTEEGYVIKHYFMKSKFDSVPQRMSKDSVGHTSDLS